MFDRYLKMIDANFYDHLSYKRYTDIKYDFKTKLNILKLVKIYHEIPSIGKINVDFSQNRNILKYNIIKTITTIKNFKHFYRSTFF